MAGNRNLSSNSKYLPVSVLISGSWGLSGDGDGDGDLFRRPPSPSNPAAEQEGLRQNQDDTDDVFTCDHSVKDNGREDDDDGRVNEFIPVRN